MGNLIALASVVLLTPFISFAAFDRDLQYGSTGSDVKEMQELLTTQGHYTGPITGNFYSLTRQAVIKFQIANNLSPAAGYFGPKSRAKANAILAAQDDASNAQAIQETGATSTPTRNDAASILQAQVNALLAQIKLLTSQVQTQTSVQQQTQTTLQQTQQSIQQIQQNTTPTPPPAPTPPPPPVQVVKDLAVSADKTSLQLMNGNTVNISATYTENGKPVPADVSFSAPDASQTYNIVAADHTPQPTGTIPCNNIPLLIKVSGQTGGTCSTDGKVTYNYTPKTVGTQTITVTANGVSKTLTISVTPYVKNDPSVQNVVQKSPSITVGDDQLTLGSFTIAAGDENVSVSGRPKYTSDLPDQTFVQFSVANNSISLILVPKSSTYTIPPGTHTVTITDVEAYGVTSGLRRQVSGLPITFSFVVNDVPAPSFIPVQTTFTYKPTGGVTLGGPFTLGTIGSFVVQTGANRQIQILCDGVTEMVGGANVSGNLNLGDYYANGLCPNPSFALRQITTDSTGRTAIISFWLEALKAQQSQISQNHFSISINGLRVQDVKSGIVKSINNATPFTVDIIYP